MLDITLKKSEFMTECRFNFNGKNVMAEFVDPIRIPKADYTPADILGAVLDASVSVTYRVEGCDTLLFMVQMNPGDPDGAISVYIRSGPGSGKFIGKTNIDFVAIVTMINYAGIWG